MRRLEVRIGELLGEPEESKGGRGHKAFGATQGLDEHDRHDFRQMAAHPQRAGGGQLRLVVERLGLVRLVLGFLGHKTTRMLVQTYRHRVKRVVDLTDAQGRMLGGA